MLKKINGRKKLTGHNFGNMLLTILSSYAGSFPDAVEGISEILEVKGKVLPVTIDKATLAAELIDKNRIYGESAIDIPESGERKEIRDIVRRACDQGLMMSTYGTVSARWMCSSTSTSRVWW